MAYDQWLERPYDDAAERSAADEEAQELGYIDAYDYAEALDEAEADRQYDRKVDRQIVGEWY